MGTRHVVISNADIIEFLSWPEAVRLRSLEAKILNRKHAKGLSIPIYIVKEKRKNEEA